MRRLGPRYSETARKRSFEYLPNDPLFPRQWGLRNTGQVFFDDEPAGTPDAVFRTTPGELLRVTGATPASFAER